MNKKNNDKTYIKITEYPENKNNEFIIKMLQKYLLSLKKIQVKYFNI